jgi:phenylpropionate dioxygenase-like ring-hydroxylating dioxygenase large terminal subunit
MAATYDPKSMAFSEEENEGLTRVGAGTLMGDLFRQYWIAVLPLSFLAEAGGVPRRVRLLGEDLVLFRTRRGQVGLVGAYCAHRLAPLFFGRIEDDGIRCPYHGWKYAPNGQCMEMPNVPAEQQFCDMIRHPGYPCVEHGGIIWTYMGPAKELPPLPEFEYTMVPEDQRRYRLFRSEANYLQVLEGGIDPTHVMWLHSPYDLSDDEIATRNQGPQQVVANKSRQRTPEAIEIVDTTGGFMYGARRPLRDGTSLWRVNQFIVPFYSMPPGGDLRGARMYVPIDDESCVKWQIGWYPTREIMEKTKETPRLVQDEESYGPTTNQPFGFIIPRANKSNDYLIDWELTKSRRLGIAGVNLQDMCVTENEGPSPILDRTAENLCSGDQTTFKARRILLKLAKSLREHGTVPVGVTDPSIYRVRATSSVVPDNVNWVEGVKDKVTVVKSAA